MRSPSTALSRSVLLVVALLGPTLGGGCVSPPAPPAAPALDDLAWLAGTWRCTDEDGAWIEERWSVPAGDSMIGTGRTVRNGRLAECEFIRILQRGPDDRVYLASPGGNQAPIEFKAVRGEGDAASSRASSAQGEAVFENLSHDFPQRISYVRSGSQLVVSIAGDVRGTRNSLMWVMFRAP